MKYAERATTVETAVSWNKEGESDSGDAIVGAGLGPTQEERIDRWLNSTSARAGTRKNFAIELEVHSIVAGRRQWAHSSRNEVGGYEAQ